MRVTILHQAVDPDAPEDERDVLLQADAIGQSLHRLGHTVQRTEVTLDLEQARLDLVATDPDRVFYLVESLDGTDSLAPLPAFLLETMQIAYTGAPAAALVLANNKLRSKRTMTLAGLPTPPWFATSKCATACSLPVPQSPKHCQQVDRATYEPSDLSFPATFIIKPVEEHASQGMTDDCVFQASDLGQLQDKLDEQSARIDRPYFAEAYVAGREFNLALLGTPGGTIVLPPAEIDFSAYPSDKPHIVGYAAKWASDSFEYNSTPRRFPCTSGSDDAELGERLADLARHCWQLFDLRGYARVDFRVDSEGRSWILEINANPCLAPDAGFAAALTQAGIPFDHAVQSILDHT